MKKSERKRALFMMRLAKRKGTSKAALIKHFVDTGLASEAEMTVLADEVWDSIPMPEDEEE